MVSNDYVGRVLGLVLCMVGALIKPFCCSFGQFDWAVGPLLNLVRP
jgi:hypothetical protein